MVILIFLQDACADAKMRDQDGKDAALPKL